MGAKDIRKGSVLLSLDTYLPNNLFLTMMLYILLKVFSFFFQDNTVLHVNTHKCMTVSLDGQKLLMEKCTGIDRQTWEWKRKSPNGIIRANG